jgi:hypothetical protein
MAQEVIGSAGVSPLTPGRRISPGRAGRAWYCLDVTGTTPVLSQSVIRPDRPPLYGSLTAAAPPSRGWPAATGPQEPAGRLW